MGRPRKQTVDYFPHFTSSDSKTKFILEQNWGNDGYAFWFKLLELLGRSDGHYYDCSKAADSKYLAALTRIDENTVKEILDTLADLGNIDPELWTERKVIWCQNFVDNLQDVYSKRTAVIPKKPFTEPEGPETPPESKPQKPEEKPKKKTKTTAKRKSILTVAQQALFEKFYSAYPKKVDRATAERAWAKIDPQPDDEFTEKIIQAVEAARKYDSRFREKQYIPNPASWLNAKGYLNEYEQEGGRNNGGFNSDRGGSSWAAGHGGFKPSGGFKGQ